MTKPLKLPSLATSLQLASLTAFSLGCLFLFYFYSIHAYSSGKEVTIALTLFGILVLLIITTKRLSYAVAGLLAFAYAIGYLTWGSAIPFIQLLPFFVFFLFGEQRMWRNCYFGVVTVLLMAELFGITPVFSPDLLIGFGNSLIVTVLALPLYFLFCLLLDIYFAFTTQTTTSQFTAGKNIVEALLISGLYARLLGHFTNNLINVKIWGGNPSISSMQILELITDSEQHSMNTWQTVCKRIIEYFEEIGGTRVAYRQKLAITSAIKLTTAERKFLAMSLFDLLTNYFKHGNATEVIIEDTSTETIIDIRISSTEQKNIEQQRKKATHRIGTHLHNLSLFLSLTKLGSIQTSLAQYTTITAFHYDVGKSS